MSIRHKYRRYCTEIFRTNESGELVRYAGPTIKAKSYQEAQVIAKRTDDSIRIVGKLVYKGRTDD